MAQRGGTARAEEVAQLRNGMVQRGKSSVSQSCSHLGLTEKQKTTTMKGFSELASMSCEEGGGFRREAGTQHASWHREREQRPWSSGNHGTATMGRRSPPAMMRRRSPPARTSMAEAGETVRQTDGRWRGGPASNLQCGRRTVTVEGGSVMEELAPWGELPELRQTAGGGEAVRRAISDEHEAGGGAWSAHQWRKGGGGRRRRRREWLTGK